MDYRAIEFYDHFMSRLRSTYFLTTHTSFRRPILQSARMAELFLACLLRHRDEEKFQVHAFAVMPEHVHVLLTPNAELSIERTAQLVKGTFSFRAKKDLGFRGQIWASGYYDQRIRNEHHCWEVIEYIERNPVARGLVGSPEAFPFSSASLRWPIDEVPQWLKPPECEAVSAG